MELLIIKTKDRYLRVKGENFQAVGLDKASVYPMDQMDPVRKLAETASQKGFGAVCVKKLVLTEEDLP